MSDRKPITKWNLLALLVVVVGVVATLWIDQLRLNNWAKSGVRMPVGDSYSVDLPAGYTLVYYESTVSVPTGNVDFIIQDADGEYIHALPPENDNSFRVMFGGLSGRALWEVMVPAEGAYRFNANNFNIPLNDDDRTGDRIVFAKQPNSLSELTTQRRTIQISGATITLLAAIVLYVLHGVELRRRAMAVPPHCPQ